MQSTYSDETYRVLSEHGFEHLLWLDDESPSYEINIYYNGRPDQTLFINDTFGYTKIVDLLFDYHSRFVPEYIDDLVIVAVDCETGDHLYGRDSDG